MELYKNILLATDLNDNTAHVSQRAKALQNEFNASLSLVHCIEKLPVYAFGAGVLADVEGELLDEAKTRLAELGEQLGVSENDQHVEEEPSKLGILYIAKKINADLIILGSHSHHGLFGHLGSTASAVVHGAACDVIVVRGESN